MKSTFTTLIILLTYFHSLAQKQQYSSSLTYTFAAAFCKYIIENYGLDYFYKLYYNKEITTENFMVKLSEITGKSQPEIRKEVENLILQN